MLLRFSASNFRSLRTEQELSLVAASLKGSEDAITTVDGDLGVLRCAAIYGANASGKTNVLKALAYMARAVENSQREWKPDEKTRRDPFKLDQDEPSRFEVDFIFEGTRYQYGFVVDSTRFTDEWLYAFPGNRRQHWFTRKNQDFSFGKNLPGAKGTIKNLTRTNSLFLSAAAQNNQEGLLPVYRWFAERLNFFTGTRSGLIHSTAEFLLKESKLKDRMLRLLSVADFAVCDFSVEQKEIPERLKQIFEAMKKVPPTQPDLPLPDTLPEVYLKHRAKHNGKDFLLPMDEESAGTQAYFGLLGPIIDTLNLGAVVLVDEIDASLHPLLCLQIVRLFNSSSTNPRGAQLIFNTHDTTLLRESGFRRDQLWFTEKDEMGATHLYPLTDFKPKANENLERGYLQGRYGAIPILGDFQAALLEDE